MSFQADILLRDKHAAPPAIMLDGADKRVPLDQDGFVPIFIFDETFRLATPTLVAVGRGALQVDMGENFGFKWEDDTGINRTGKIEEVTLLTAPHDSQLWLARLVMTRDPDLTEADMLQVGLGQYVRQAISKINRVKRAAA